MADLNRPTPSLADRITTSKPLDGGSSSFNPTNSWADEVASPTGPRPSENSLTAAQVDGAGGPQQGSAIEEAEHEVEVIDSYNNESNPLHSVNSFEELGIHADILKGLYALNFKKPSKIQEKALPILIGSVPRNMIAQSQSGTGKTAAFVITILTRLDHTKPNSPQALCLAPSRELARQIEGVVKSIGRFIPDLTIQAAIPGEVQRNAKVQAMVVVGTPGTVMDLIKRRQLDTTHLKVLCLDEADNMLDQQGLGDQCMRLRQMIPNVSQSLLFSATFPDPVIQYANQFSPNAISLRLKKNDQTVAGITQMYMDVSSDQDKFDTLARVFGILGTSQSIIFCKRRDTASAIAQRLQADGHKVAALHGAFDGTERDQLLDNFRSSIVKILITTNVLARGIDVSAVSMVINWDIPTKGRNDDEADPETYLHRIGRTGRFGRVGVSISFVHDRKSYQALSAIAAHFQIELKKIDQADWDEAEVDMKRVIKESQIRAATQPTT